MLKRSSRPRTRSLTRGWVTPRRCATSACVNRRAAMAFWTLIMRSERTLRCSASSAENPRSRNTLPLEAVTLAFIRHLSFPRCALRDHDRQAMLRKVQVHLGRLARTLLEGVQNVNTVSEPGDIKDAMLESGMNPYLPHARSHRRHRLPVVRIEPALDPPQLKAGDNAGAVGKPPKVVPRATHPLRRLVHHGLVYKFLHARSTVRDLESPNMAEPAGPTGHAAYLRTPRASASLSLRPAFGGQRSKATGSGGER
jgi:hypothetical protein